MLSPFCVMKISIITDPATINEIIILIVSFIILGALRATFGKREKLTINSIVVIVSTTSCKCQIRGFHCNKNNATEKPITPFKITIVKRCLIKTSAIPTMLINISKITSRGQILKHELLPLWENQLESCHKQQSQKNHQRNNQIIIQAITH